MAEIKTLEVMPLQTLGAWCFRPSISNATNIMMMASNPRIKNSFLLRFFTDTEIAKAWVIEVASGKHLD